MFIFRLYNSPLAIRVIRLFLYFSIIFFGLIYFSSLLNLILDILDFKWFLEPAENENLVFSKYISKNSFFDLDNLIEGGILPIYPDFYHQLSSTLNPDNLYSLRLSVLFLLLFLWFYFSSFL